MEDIRKIRANTPTELEIEAFVHGAMCVSFSGRCLPSNYLTGRDANRGACAQPCRWKYHLVEEKRPGEYFEISEDKGTHIMNSRDMCMIEHIPELIDAGVTSLKIEGRMKSAYYAAAVTNAYRHAIDYALEGEALPQVWIDELNKVSHRPYCTGFTTVTRVSTLPRQAIFPMHMYAQLSKAAPTTALPSLRSATASASVIRWSY